MHLTDTQSKGCQDSRNDGFDNDVLNLFPDGVTINSLLGQVTPESFECPVREKTKEVALSLLLLVVKATEGMLTALFPGMAILLTFSNLSVPSCCSPQPGPWS